LVKTLLFDLKELVEEFDVCGFDSYFHFAGLMIITVEE
jgi:hypothetical protein